MMKGRHSLAVVGLATVALVIAACSAQDTAVTEPEIASASFARQLNRCDKYARINDTYTWQGARENAISRGGVVASISSEEEQKCVAGKMPGTNSFSNYWLNGAETATNEWRWSNNKKNGVFWRDGNSYGYTNWWNGQPDNFGGNENCLAIVDYNVDAFYPWDDQDCSASKGYIIRYP